MRDRFWVGFGVVAGCFCVCAQPSAQLPGAIIPETDSAIWGCRNHPYVAVIETRIIDPVSSQDPDAGRPQQIRVYRNSAGQVRTEAYYLSGALMTISLKAPSEPRIILLNVVERTGLEVPLPILKSSDGERTWKRSSLPKRKILGLETVGNRYMQLPPPPDLEGAKPEANSIEEDWFSPTACAVLERHVSSSSTGNSGERLVKFEQREPDPHLFEVPPEYVVQKSGPS